MTARQNTATAVTVAIIPQAGPGWVDITRTPRPTVRGLGLARAIQILLPGPRDPLGRLSSKGALSSKEDSRLWWRVRWLGDMIVVDRGRVWRMGELSAFQHPRFARMYER